MALSNLGIKLTHAEKTAIKADIRKRVKDWQPQGGLTSFRAFQEYVLSGYKTLPYEGGWLSQPTWVHHDFSIYHDVMYYHYLDNAKD